MERNRCQVLLNMAAAHMGEQEYGAAVRRCDEALAAGQGVSVGDRVKALLRRARAHTARHDHHVRPPCDAPLPPPPPAVVL